MKRKSTRQRQRPVRATERPAPGNEPDLARLGAHESRGAEPATAVDRAKLNAELRKEQGYQGL
jgi:hypothetical protein